MKSATYKKDNDKTSRRSATGKTPYSNLKVEVPFPKILPLKAGIEQAYALKVAYETHLCFQGIGIGNLLRYKFHNSHPSPWAFSLFWSLESGAISPGIQVQDHCRLECTLCSPLASILLYTGPRQIILVEWIRPYKSGTLLCRWEYIRTRN